jgi:hypothetical protein
MEGRELEEDARHEAVVIDLSTQTEGSHEHVHLKENAASQRVIGWSDWTASSLPDLSRFNSIWSVDSHTTMHQEFSCNTWCKIPILDAHIERVEDTYK